MWTPLSVRCNQGMNSMFLDGKPAKFAEIVCGDEGVPAGGQFKAARDRELSPHVRHHLISSYYRSLKLVVSKQSAPAVFVCRQLENLQQENLTLVRSLAAQEEAVAYSNRQLDQRSSECQAFSRQLDAALVDVRQQVQQSSSLTHIPGCLLLEPDEFSLIICRPDPPCAQVNRVRDQAASREEALRNKILTLEAEKSRKESELRLLRQSQHKVGSPFKVRRGKLSSSCLDCCQIHPR